jgi:hypothetical protein
MISRGVGFLLARQGYDGLWRDFLTLGGEAADWPTGFVGAQLVTATSQRVALHRAADCLLARQQVLTDTG